MKAALISMGSTSSHYIEQALRKHFDTVDHLDIKDLEVSLVGKSADALYKGKPLAKYDCIYPRGSAKYSNLLRAIATIITGESYNPLTPAAFTIGHDKILTHFELQAARVPMPRTWIVSRAESAKNILKKVPYPIVMKFPSGTHGKGVMIAESYDSASSMIDALALLKQPFLIQEYIDTDGTDTRALVVGDQVVAAMQRTAATGERRANLHAGGTGKQTNLDDHTKHIAILAAKAVGAEICGVDILQGIKGPMIIEVNLSPGLQGITKATGINVAEEIAKHLAKKTKDYLIKQKEETLRDLIQDKSDIITKLDFRNERILLPSIITKLAKLTEQEDVIIEAHEGEIKIKKY